MDSRLRGDDRPGCSFAATSPSPREFISHDGRWVTRYASAGRRIRISRRSSASAISVCSTTVATLRYHMCSSSNQGCDDNQIVGSTNVSTRVPELNNAGTVLPSAWKRLEQVVLRPAITKFQETIERKTEPTRMTSSSFEKTRTRTSGCH